LPTVRISPEWVTSPEQGKSSGRKATLASGQACFVTVLGRHLKMTGIINHMFRPQKTLKKRRRKLYNTLAFQLCCTVVKTGPLKKKRKKNSRNNDENV
jgi:hypothetical protein